MPFFGDTFGTRAAQQQNFLDYAAAHQQALAQAASAFAQQQVCITGTTSVFFNTTSTAAGTTLFSSDFSAPINATSTITTGTNTYQNVIASHYQNAIARGVLNSVIVIDEDDYMNNAEYYELARQRGVLFRIRTAEEKRRAEELAIQAREMAEAREAKFKEIRDRARELLLSHLTAAQRDTFVRNKWFVVVGGKTKTRYRIHTDQGLNGNIAVLAKYDHKVATLCCHCSAYSIPADDQFLAQKLALMYDEDNFLRTANRRAA